MTNLRDYDRDATLIEKMRDLERRLSNAHDSLDIAYAKGREDGCADGKHRTEAQYRAELATCWQMIEQGKEYQEKQRVELAALHDRLRQERERCAKVCEANGNPGADGWSCAAKIRNMGDE